MRDGELEETRDFWDRVADDWQIQVGDDGDSNRILNSDPVLWEFAGDVRGLIVLDAGCGTGYLSKKLRISNRENARILRGLISNPSSSGFIVLFQTTGRHLRLQDLSLWILKSPGSWKTDTISPLTKESSRTARTVPIRLRSSCGRSIRLHNQGMRAARLPMRLHFHR